jgi:glucose-6-phosphate isomerase
MSWSRFTSLSFHDERLAFTLDLSRMGFGPEALDALEPKFRQVFDSMAALEQGAIANPDEQRMVGHYWLRSPALAPTPEIKTSISDALTRIEDFAGRVHRGELAGPRGPFKQVLVIGIGGSALGPQFVREALGNPKTDKMAVWFFDNTDPDGMDTVLASLSGKLHETLVLVISKSGGTVETRNGMLEAAAAFKAAGLNYPKHFVAITGEGSKLDHIAQGEGWLARFPMWDWVGGRTSELGPVGLLPAALQGLEIGEILAGAAAMDMLTRTPKLRENPAALLAAAWFPRHQGRRAKDMVVSPTRTPPPLLALPPQLIMESLGKELDLAGRVVNQGIAVYGNKGFQRPARLRAATARGVNNFFSPSSSPARPPGESMEVEAGITSATTSRLLPRYPRCPYRKEPRVAHDHRARCLAAHRRNLIALYERAVASTPRWSASTPTTSPGREAGKKAAGSVIVLKKKIARRPRRRPWHRLHRRSPRRPPRGRRRARLQDLEHLAANPQSGVRKTPAAFWHQAKFTPERASRPFHARRRPSSPAGLFVPTTRGRDLARCEAVRLRTE